MSEDIWLSDMHRLWEMTWGQGTAHGVWRIGSDPCTVFDTEGNLIARTETPEVAALISKIPELVDYRLRPRGALVVQRTVTTAGGTEEHFVSPVGIPSKE